MTLEVIGPWIILDQRQKRWNLRVGVWHGGYHMDTILLKQDLFLGLNCVRGKPLLHLERQEIISLAPAIIGQFLFFSKS